jgi:HNH endonuclease
MPFLDRFGRKVYGPYLSKQENRRLVLLYWDGGKKTMSYARWMMEEHLGRVLTDKEEVDHRDDNKLNDVISNFQILTRLANTKKSAAAAEMAEVICQHCGKKQQKPMRHIRHNQTRRKCRGPFCDKVCARAAQVAGYPALG